MWCDVISYCSPSVPRCRCLCARLNLLMLYNEVSVRSHSAAATSASPAPCYSHVGPNTSYCVTNPTPDVAGLHAVLAQMLALPAELLNSSRSTSLRALQRALPPLPVTRPAQGIGAAVQAGASIVGKARNSENAALYSVYPFKLFDAVWSPNASKKLALNTYEQRPTRGNTGVQLNCLCHCNC